MRVMSHCTLCASRTPCWIWSAAAVILFVLLAASRGASGAESCDEGEGYRLHQAGKYVDAHLVLAPCENQKSVSGRTLYLLGRYVELNIDERYMTRKEQMVRRSKLFARAAFRGNEDGIFAYAKILDWAGRASGRQELVTGAKCILRTLAFPLNTRGLQALKCNLIMEQSALAKAKE